MKLPGARLGFMAPGQVLEPAGPAAAAAVGSAAWLAPERLESRALFLPQPCSRGMSASTSAPAAAPLLPCLCCLPGSESAEGSLCAGGRLLRLSGLPAGGELGWSSSEGLLRLRAELGSSCCCWLGCMASCAGLRRGRNVMRVSKLRIPEVPTHWRVVATSTMVVAQGVAQQVAVQWRLPCPQMAHVADMAVACATCTAPVDLQVHMTAARAAQICSKKRQACHSTHRPAALPHSSRPSHRLTWPHQAWLSCHHLTSPQPCLHPAAACAAAQSARTAVACGPLRAEVAHRQRQQQQHRRVA